MLGLEDGSILVDGYRGIVYMAWQEAAEIQMLARQVGRANREIYVREKLRCEGTKAEELCICCDMTSLGSWEPRYPPALTIWLRRVEDAELDGQNVGGVRRGCARRVEVGNWDLDIGGANFVGACVLRKRGNRVDSVEIVRHSLRVGRLLCLGRWGRHVVSGSGSLRWVAGSLRARVRMHGRRHGV